MPQHVAVPTRPSESWVRPRGGVLLLAGLASFGVLAAALVARHFQPAYRATATVELRSRAAEELPAVLDDPTVLLHRADWLAYALERHAADAGAAEPTALRARLHARPVDVAATQESAEPQAEGEPPVVRRYEFRLTWSEPNEASAMLDDLTDRFTTTVDQTGQRDSAEQLVIAARMRFLAVEQQRRAVERQVKWHRSQSAQEEGHALERELHRIEAALASAQASRYDDALLPATATALSPSDAPSDAEDSLVTAALAEEVRVRETLAAKLPANHPALVRLDAKIFALAKRAGIAAPARAKQVDRNVIPVAGIGGRGAAEIDELRRRRDELAAGLEQWRLRRAALGRAEESLTSLDQQWQQARHSLDDAVAEWRLQAETPPIACTRVPIEGEAVHISLATPTRRHVFLAGAAASLLIASIAGLWPRRRSRVG